MTESETTARVDRGAGYLFTVPIAVSSGHPRCFFDSWFGTNRYGTIAERERERERVLVFSFISTDTYPPFQYPSRYRPVPASARPDGREMGPSSDGAQGFAAVGAGGSFIITIVYISDDRDDDRSSAVSPRRDRQTTTSMAFSETRLSSTGGSEYSAETERSRHPLSVLMIMMIDRKLK